MAIPGTRVEPPGLWYNARTMKILLINKFYYLSGGAERYVFEWEKVLRARGHEVLLFSMRHPRNLPCRQERFFIDEVRFDTRSSPGAQLRAAAHSIWSGEARRQLEALLHAEGRPDIVHLHSFMYQLTPSILKPLVARGIPIVQTTHEYSAVCVNQHLYDHRSDRICERCLRGSRLSPVATACVKGSRAASAAAYAAGWVDRWVGGTRRHVRRFLAPSAFMRGKLIEGGLPADRVFHVPNFINAEAVRPAETPGDAILFLGRLVPQKGVMTFLKAAQMAPEVPCAIVGGGALEPLVRAAASTLPNVQVLGHREGEELTALIGGARAVVAPSEWYEPFGLVILEALAAARPVIASAIAGPAEVISDGIDGLLTPPGDAPALAEALRALWRRPDRAQAMGRAGREKALTRYNAEGHYQQLMEHFDQVHESR